MSLEIIYQLFIKESQIWEKTNEIMLTDYQRYRIYEILPGLSIWSILLLSLILSAIKPLWMIYAIIIFDIYWVIKVANFSFYLLVAWRRFRIIRCEDWRDRLFHEVPNWAEKKHFIFLTLYNEPWEVVRSSIKSIAESVYDKEKFIIIIAGEERKKENYQNIYQKIKVEFNDCFGDIIGIMHPAYLIGEVPGKGSNLHYAEKKMKEYADLHNWNYDNLIATFFDIDTVVHPHYFSYLTYLYCSISNPTRRSYQPIALYNNNIWESPAILRLMAFGTTFWTLTSLARQDLIVTFSSHSMSFRTLVDVGFHEKRIVSEDSRIFYQCLLHYNGDYSVMPMYLPVSMDTVRDDNWWISIKNLYKQQRRWAWGIEHVPYLLNQFRQKKNFPFWKKVKWIFIEWEGKWSWCLAALIITILGRLPMWLAPESVRQSALFFNAPHLLQMLMGAAMFGLLLSAVLSFPLLPERPKTQPRHKYLIMLFQWLLLPISMIFISAIPAFDAVTHLMLGRYLGFNVSPKKRQ